MKHVTTLLLAIVTATGICHAATHEVRIANGYSSTITLTVTDQNGNNYEKNVKYNLEESVILTFTLSNTTDFCVQARSRDAGSSGIIEPKVTTYEIKADSPSKLTFSVVPISYTITLWVKPTDGGKVDYLEDNMVIDPDPGLSDPSIGKYVHSEISSGTNVKFHAKPNSGYEFLCWKGLGSSNPLEMTVKSDLDICPYFGFSLTDNENATYYAERESSYSGKTRNVMLKDRTLKGGMWNTLCLPFAVPQEQVEALFGKGCVYRLKSASGDYNGLDIFVDPVISGGLEAGYPYLIRPTDNIVEPVFEDVTPAVFTNQAARSTAASAIKLQGTLQPTTMTAGDKQTLFIGNNDKVFFPSVGNNIRAYRAYFVINDTELPPSAPERTRFLVVGRDVPSDYTAAQEEQHTSGKYLRNGQLIIEKDGRQYNAQGMLIR